MLIKFKPQGIFFVLPCIDSYTKVDLRTVSFDVPPQEVGSTFHLWNHNITTAFSQLLIATHSYAFQGADKRQRDSIGRCRGLLQGQQCNRFRGQRGKRSPLHQAPRSNHAEERPWDEKLVGNFGREGIDIKLHAGRWNS